MMNRYEGEIRINPIAILRNHDFNNEGEIADILNTLQDTIELNSRINAQLTRLIAYLESRGMASQGSFNFAPGGYIAVKGFTDAELLEMKQEGLIDVFDFATDRDWVKKYGARFGLVWEKGRAVPMD